MSGNSRQSYSSLFPNACLSEMKKFSFSHPSWLFYCIISIALFFYFLPYTAFAEETAKNRASLLTTKIDGLRFSATSAYNQQVSADKVEVFAQTAARANAMKILMRHIAHVPEVRVAANSLHEKLNLLAIAHAVGRTTVLLVSHSRKEASTMVTVAITEKDTEPSIEGRIHEVLVIPERLALYEEILFREEAIMERYNSLFPLQATTGGVSVWLTEAQVAEIEQLANELHALDAFKKYVPSWSGTWDDPITIRNITQNLLRQAPYSALIHHALGNAWLQLGRSQEAMEAQTQAIKNAHTFAAAYHTRGVAAMTLGLFSSATADISEAIRLSPKTAVFYRDRGLVAYLGGDIPSMCADFHEACALGECRKLHWAEEEKLCTFPHTAK